MPRLAALLAVVAVISGCGGGGDSRREAVESYIEQANRTYEQFEPEVRNAQRALRSFAEGRAGPKLAERLRSATAIMRSTRARLALIEPPSEARPLHRDLLELLDLQARLSLELSLAADYLPRATKALRPADKAGTRLARSLRRATTAPEQAEALEQYVVDVDKALARLEGLGTPPMLEPWHRAQRDRVVAFRNLADGLAGGIRKGDRDAIDRALRAFSAETPDRKPAQRAQRQAIAVFNERLDEQQELLSRIYREQGALLEQFSS